MSLCQATLTDGGREASLQTKSKSRGKENLASSWAVPLVHLLTQTKQTLTKFKDNEITLAMIATIFQLTSEGLPIMASMQTLELLSTITLE